MGTVYLKRRLYDSLIQKGLDITVFINEAVEEKLKEEKQK